MKRFSSPLTKALLAFLLLMLCQPTCNAQKSSTREAMPAGRYAELVYFRIISIAQSVLKLEQQALEKLAAKKPVDKHKLQARLLSARLQMQKLIRLGRGLEKQMDTADPARAKVESLRQRLFYFVTMHKKNIEQIVAYDDFKGLSQISASMIEVIEKNSEADRIELLKIGNLDRAF